MPSLQGVVPAGVVTGANLMKLLEYCRDNEMALPAFNCTSSSTVNAVLQAARDANSAVMIQVSHCSYLKCLVLIVFAFCINSFVRFYLTKSPSICKLLT